MAITAYTGLQGSGKSYEVVKNVILSNLLAGRDVVTNIYGLKDEEIKSYLVDKYKAEPDKLGKIVHVSNEEVTLAFFFPWEGMQDGVVLSVRTKTSPFQPAKDIPFDWSTEPKYKANCSIVQPGNVVVLDEVWRWYATGESIPFEHQKFFRMHRHFTSAETGVSCDVVLIIQVLEDLQRKVLKVVEKNFHMTKHKALGLDNRYVVNVYGGYRQTEKALIESHQESYQPEIFNLYSSYSQNKSGLSPKEQAADSRGKLWGRWHFKVGIPLAIVGMAASAIYLWRFFHPHPKPTVAQQGLQAGQVNKGPDVSDKWRVVGFYDAGVGRVFILQNADGRVRFLSGAQSKEYANDLELILPDGSFATSWSGAMPVSGQSRRPRGLL